MLDHDINYAIENRNVLVITYRNPFLGSGTQGEVYAISDKKAAKLYYPAKTNYGGYSAENDPESIATREYYIQKMLHDEGISVPEPHGIEKVILKRPGNLFGLIDPERIALIMERIHGIRGDKLKGAEREIVERLFLEEKRKAEGLGFILLEARLQDTIYVPSERKIYLLDSGRTRHPSDCFL